jgi:DNA-binding NarL/FixJ family response regulator
MGELRVLLVDDSPAFLNAARQLIARIPCVAHVACADSGAAALAQLGAVNPHLVITDIAMPEMSGFELIRKLRAQERALRVVAVTLHDGPEFRAAARRSGADGFISKSEFGVVVGELVTHLAEATTT